MNKLQKFILAIGAGLVVLAIVLVVYVLSIRPSKQPQAGASVDTSSLTTSEPTNAQLRYLIEEEKLAHDIYEKLYQQYGVAVFRTIAQSEISHQSQLLLLLEARSIADPRSKQAGVFTNAELQELYNVLVAQGDKSLEDAYRVGVAVEERDIKDISKQLETATDPDVTTTLERLWQASENHLRAFSRQLSR